MLTSNSTLLAISDVIKDHAHWHLTTKMVSLCDHNYKTNNRLYAFKAAVEERP